MPRIPYLPILVTILGVLATRLYGPLKTKYQVAGFPRPRDQIVSQHGAKLVKIPHTLQCEDLHHHLPSNKLFTACEDEAGPDLRRSWFPPLALFDAKKATGRGSLVVIDPKGQSSTHLTLEGFDTPFITHGIDVFSSFSNPNLVYIFAINHLAHPEAAMHPMQAVLAVSQIEVFSHYLDSTSANHVRSIQHPDIITPNDIYATSPTSFYVTNDHYYRDGPLRTFEDLGWRGIAGWTNTKHVIFDPQTTHNATSGVQVTTALTGLHNNNGLGHGEAEDIVVIGCAASGELVRAQRDLDHRHHPELKVLEYIQLASPVDNPSYFKDEYASPGNDASGYVVAGLQRAVEIVEDVKDPERRLPVMVWHLQRNATAASQGMSGDDAWTKKVIFQDDGREVNSAATAVLIGVDPREYGGKKKAWLYVTGFMSDNVVATLIDL